MRTIKVNRLGAASGDHRSQTVTIAVSVEIPLELVEVICQVFDAGPGEEGCTPLDLVKQFIEPGLLEKANNLRAVLEPPPTCKWCGQNSCDCQARMDCPEAGATMHVQCGKRSCGCPNFVTCECLSERP